MASLILRLDIGDAVIDRSTKILRENLGVEVITARNMLYKLAQVGADETVYINGHGSPNSIGGLSVNELAGLLAKGGLRGPVNIVVIACNTGWGGAPYALNLKIELIQSKKIRSAVSAPNGFISVRNDGSTYVDMDIVAPDGSIVAVPVPLERATFATTKSF
jgi:hypothetical protein